MSSRRISIWLAVLAVLFIAHPPTPGARIENSISDSATSGAPAQISAGSKPARVQVRSLGAELLARAFYCFHCRCSALLVAQITLRAAGKGPKVRSISFDMSTWISADFSGGKNDGTSDTVREEVWP